MCSIQQFKHCNLKRSLPDKIIVKNGSILIELSPRIPLGLVFLASTLNTTSDPKVESSLRRISKVASTLPGLKPLTFTSMKPGKPPRTAVNFGTKFQNKWWQSELRDSRYKSIDHNFATLIRTIGPVYRVMFILVPMVSLECPLNIDTKLSTNIHRVWFLWRHNDMRPHKNPEIQVLYKSKGNLDFG